MAEVIVAQRMWQRRDTLANWNSKNPVLNAGEWGVELVPGTKLMKAKLGDGVTAWRDLPYYAGGSAVAGVTEVRPGANVQVDNTDPQRPIVSATVNSIQLRMPFYLSNNTYAPIALTTDYKLPFFLSDGTRADIQMVTT